MGMTDQQFKAFIRLLISNMEKVNKEENPEKKQELTRELMDLLQTMLED